MDLQTGRLAKFVNKFYRNIEKKIQWSLKLTNIKTSKVLKSC